MNKYKICEELYALPGNRIIKLRKPVRIPLLLAAAGAVLLIVNATVAGESANVKSALVFAGGVLLVTGLAVCCMRLFGGDGAPYSPAARAFLRYEERYFDRSKLPEVIRLAEAVDVEGLLAMESQTVPVVAVAIFRAPDNSFAACQVYEYVELEYRPLCPLKVA